MERVPLTGEQKDKVSEMRMNGQGYNAIAIEIGAKREQVRSYCRNKSVGLTGKMVKLAEAICKECGVTFIPNSQGQTFCSDMCRVVNFKSSSKEKRTCKRCGKPFESYKALYCSTKCREIPDELKKVNLYKPNLKVSRQCIYCSKVFETGRANQKFCNKDCSYQYRLKQLHEQRKDEATHYSKRCKECGKHFTCTRSKAKYCSSACNIRCGNRQKETTRRKRIMKNGKVDWDISIERLLKRDGHVCYLCGEQVITNIDTNDDYYPSIEHIIPVSKGGTHTWGNVKLAHRYCNTIKGDKMI